MLTVLKHIIHLEAKWYIKNAWSQLSFSDFEQRSETEYKYSLSIALLV